MATGPELFAKALELDVKAEAAYAACKPETAKFLLARAQVHATLALAAATAMSGSMPYPDLEAWDAACGVQEEEHDDDSFDPFAPEDADANPLRHTPLARAFGAIPDLPDDGGGALNDNGRDYIEEDAVRRAGREEGEAEQAEESFEDREVAYRKRLAATSYPVTVHYGPYVREQIHGEACAICFRDFKRGEETERYDARDSDAELYRHVTCQPPATAESGARS